jgi:hypothetical protein
VSLRETPLSDTAALPDGRDVRIDLRVLDDDYVEEPQRTVILELRDGEEVLASLSTLLEPEQSDEGRRLVDEVRTGLETGELEPTAGALEPLADAV